MKNLLQTLKEAGQDKEFYPTSRRMLELVAKRPLHPDLCLLPNKKLVTVSKALGIDLGDKSHNAEADILATIEVWKKLVEFDEKGVINV